MKDAVLSSCAEQDAFRLDAQLLSDLWVFRAAARHGSITGAAAALNVTQGAVSQRVLRLEARLGTELFRRSQRKIALTPSGMTLLGAVNGASAGLNDALSRIARSQGGALVVVCPPSLAIEWLMPHLPDFYRECQGIELHVRAEMVAPHAYWMEEQRVDVVIGYSHAPIAGLCQLAEFAETIFPVCSPATRQRLDAQARQRPDAQPADLCDVLLMHDDAVWLEGELAGAEWREWLDHVAEKPRWRVTAERHFNLAYLAYQAAIYGDGLAMARSIGIQRLIGSGLLVPALDRPPVPSAHYRLMSLLPAREGSSAARFSEWLLATMRRTQQRVLEALAQH